MVVLLLLVGSTSLAARAQEGGGFRIGLYGGVLVTEPAETIATGPTVGFRIGYQFDPVFALEGNLGFSQATTRTTGRLARVLTPRLDVLFHIPTDTVVTPFFVVGPGLIYKKVNRDASVEENETNDEGYGMFKNPDTDFLLNAGGGVLVALGKDSPVLLRLDLRYLPVIGTEPHAGRDVDYFNYMEATVSLMGRFGPRDKDTDRDGYLDSEDGCPEDPEDFDEFEDHDGCPDPDNDRDGITDELDSCPDEPEDVDEYRDLDGCPDPDNDDDGVLDTRDECPMEPGPARTHGCPDRDGDRVPDYRDDCPDEPADSRVDPSRSDGCPSKVVVTEDEVVILDKVYFNTNKATIKPVSYAILDEVVSVLQKYTDITEVEVAGHTDREGSDSYNMDLSQRRAEAVRQYLIDHGVDGRRLTATGYGETSPIDTNETPEGRANNRRVEFHIIER